jgi:transposase
LPRDADRVLTLLQETVDPLRGSTINAAQKHPTVIEWLGRHPCVTFHFTPTSASWLNAVEGFFAKLTKQRLKRGVFHSLVSLHGAINRYVAQANNDPRRPSARVRLSAAQRDSA